MFLPVAVVKEWQDHQTCGTEFKAWLDKFLETHGKLIDPDEERKKEEEEKRKRMGDGANPSPKKAKTVASEVSKECVVSHADIQQPLLSEVKLDKGMPTLHFRGADSCYLVNASDKPWTATHPAVAMFGNGSYKILKEGVEAGDKSIELIFQSSEDLVILGGQIQKIGQVIADMRAKKPDCKICYFNMEDEQHTNLPSFKLKASHRVVFQKKDDQQEGTIAKHNAGMKLPFRSSPVLKVLWHVRWTTKGLSPVKPACHVIGQVTLAPGEALRLHHEQPQAA